jgi:hypothetical protein
MHEVQACQRVSFAQRLSIRVEPLESRTAGPCKIPARIAVVYNDELAPALLRPSI